MAIRKRPDTGLLAGLYEFPNVEGHLKQKEVIEYAKSLGLTPVRVKKLPDAKHIFSHVEWQMKGYEVIVDELERELDQKIWSEQVIFAEKEELERSIRCHLHLQHISYKGLQEKYLGAVCKSNR